MSNSRNGFVKQVFVTILGAFVGVSLTLWGKSCLDRREEKDMVRRVVANAYNEAHHNIDLLTNLSKENIPSNVQLTRWQISTDSIDQLYRNVSISKYLEAKHTTGSIPWIRKEYRGVLAILELAASKNSSISNKEISGSIDALKGVRELLDEMGSSMTCDKQWRQYTVPWTETVRQILERYKKKK